MWCRRQYERDGRLRDSNNHGGSGSGSGSMWQLLSLLHTICCQRNHTTELRDAIDVLTLILPYDTCSGDWVTMGGIHTIVTLITDITIGSLLKEPVIHCLLAALQTSVALEAFLTLNGTHLYIFYLSIDVYRHQFHMISTV